MNWRLAFQGARYWWELVLGGIGSTVIVLGTFAVLDATESVWMAGLFFIPVGAIFVVLMVMLRQFADRRLARKSSP